MECRANSDVFFLPDEKFDFDVSLSPASSTGGEDEDEVFVGPVTHKERCVTVHVASKLEDGGVRVSWSPLTGDQLEAVCQEAHRLANQLQNVEPNNVHNGNKDATNTTMDREEFIQDAEDKLGVLSQVASALSPIKRETFCVQDSPMKQLPPAVQRRLLKGSSANASLSTRATATSTASASRTNVSSTAFSTRPTARLSTSSPVTGTKVQPRVSLRGKASLGVGVVLPSKPAAPTILCSTSKSRVEKTKLQPPSKPMGGRRQSTVSRASSRAESYEDLLSDSTSIASDISDSSLNSSLLGKRTLAPPSKSAVRNLSGVKAPALQSRRVADRKNTSSSSSSVSSFNSSISLSPAKGKVNSSLNRSLSSSTGLAPSSVSKTTNLSRPRRSTVYTTTEPVSSTTGRSSLSTQAKKLSELERAKSTRSTPLKRAEALPVQPTPPKRALERTTTIPPTALVRLQGGVKAKPQALVVPTPTGGVKGVRSGDDASKMKPKRLMSVGGISSLPHKPTAGPLTPSTGESRLLQVKAQRPSALPTPVRRRTSAIPTPTSHTRPPRLLLTSDTDPAPTSPNESSCSPVHADTQEVESVEVPDVQPFSLEEDEEQMVIPVASPSCAPENEHSESPDPGMPIQDQSKPNGNLIELESAEEANTKTQEVLLFDLPAPALQPQEKLLIDLSNTPDLVRTSSKSCTTTQLIDLSSPLIKWSPEDKKENNAPLINLSF